MANPNPKKSVPVIGKSAVDILKSWSTPRFIRPEDGAAATPPASGLAQDILQLREQVAREKLVQLTVDEVETDLEARRANSEATRVEAEARGIEARVKLEELKADLREKSGSQGNQALLAVIEILQGELAAAREANAGRGESITATMMEKIMAETARTRQELIERISSGGEKQDPTSFFGNMIEQLTITKKIIDELFPHEKPSIVSAASQDLQTTIMLQKTQFDHEARMMELRMQERRWEEEQALRREETRSQELRSRSYLDGIKTLADNFAPAINRLANRAVGQAEEIPVASAHKVESSVVEEAPKPATWTDMPAISKLSCSSCGHGIEIKQGDEVATCPECNSTFQVDWSGDRGA